MHRSEDTSEEIEEKRVDPADLVVHGYLEIPGAFLSVAGVANVKRLICPFAYSLQRSNRFARAGDLNGVRSAPIFDPYGPVFLLEHGDGTSYKGVAASDIRFGPIDTNRVKIYAAAHLRNDLPARIIHGLASLALAGIGSSSDVVAYLATAADVLREYVIADKALDRAGRRPFSQLNDVPWSSEAYIKLFPHTNDSGRGGPFFSHDRLGHEVYVKFHRVPVAFPNIQGKAMPHSSL